MFKPVDSSLNFRAREDEIAAFWDENKIFEQYKKLRDGEKTYTFYDGPPTANGKPHVGHVLTRAYKDLIPRYRTMKGYDVLRKAGWDTHGLPVEIEVEKTLHLDGKEQIEAYGVEPFIKACKTSVWKYLGEWKTMSDKVAFWVDMDNPYVTYDNNYIESIWWSLKQIHEKGLLYKGAKTVPYCPRCGTALSSHEVAQAYKKVIDETIVVRFEKADEKGVYFLAWTTTPWTLPSNLAICVNPNETYSRVKTDDGVYILAKARIPAIIKDEFEIVSECAGRELAGQKYIPLYPAEVDKPAWFVTCDNYVTMDDGTGIVHIAPAFGDDDSRVGRDNDLPFLQRVDTQGNLTGGTKWDGLFVKKADPKIIADLKERGLAHATMPHEHDYPFCWRCDTPLIYYARPTWYIRMTAVRDQLVEANRSVRWLPDNIKEGRMGNFVENVIDWGLSRERYWGTPLPVWHCSCGHVHVIGSIEELKKRVKNVPDDIELHRPYIDEIEITCEKCGKPVKRVKEVIDCWYDSGSMPFAQWHYPFENKELFEKRFPAQFICEAVDQTRGWFYTLLAISTLLFGKAPFETCLVLGHVLDKDGRKMSKHLGNVITPDEIISVTGADAIRWYFYVNAAPWLPTRFALDMVAEQQRKFMGTLWNTYAFFILYANIDAFSPNEGKPTELPTLDKWLLSRLNSLIIKVDESLAAEEIVESARAIAAFVDDLSNWYVRRSRERFWGKGMYQDKEAAFHTLYTTLVTLSKLLAPFTPFLAESMYTNLVASVDSSAPKSVHLTDFPAADRSLIDETLERDMDTLINIVSLGRSCRMTANIKVRQPVSVMYVVGANLPESFAALAKDELNVKEIEQLTDTKDLVSYRIKPQLRTLGPRFGRKLKDISQALANLAPNDAYDIVRRANANEPITLTVGGETVELAASDVLIETERAEGYVSETGGGVTVALDTRLTEELISEGYARETISKIQTLRKDAGFDVTDRIDARVICGGKLSEAIERHKEFVASVTLASTIDIIQSTASEDDADGFVSQTFDINGETATIEIRRI